MSKLIIEAEQALQDLTSGWYLNPEDPQEVLRDNAAGREAVAEAYDPRVTRFIVAARTLMPQLVNELRQVQI